MSAEIVFPSLAGWESTRRTLHLYSNILGVVPRVHAEFHPKWWHISLKVQPDGLTTDSMALPGGGSFSLKMDLRNHQIVLSSSDGERREFSMREGLSASDLGNRVLGAVAELGLSGDYAREKFENDEPREYDAAIAENFRAALVSANHIFNQHRDTLSGEKGPVQLWPHGFDLAFEWFGTRVEVYEEHGKVERYPSQLNLGLSPGEPNHPQPYFYSNPWPFEKALLLDKPLPSGARWFTAGWEGSILPYEALVGDSQAGERLFAFAQAVYKYAAPTLSA